MEKLTRAKRSPIWKMGTEELKSLVERSDTMTEVLEHFGLKNKGGNNRTLRLRLAQDGIDCSKFSSNYGRGQLKHYVSLNEALVENSTYARASLKKRLIQEGLLENKCSKCGLGNEWLGDPLVLILDHKNGIPNDNRLTNLRLLCPNCNSQTPTFAGRNLKKEKKKYYCKCGILMSEFADSCSRCEKLSRRKAERPDREVLLRMVEEKGFVGVGREYGVSDNAIRKWLKLK